jgi:hypothetical protein
MILNNKRPNLLQSALLELFLLVVSADNKPLQKYVSTTFAPLLQWSGLLALVDAEQSDGRNSSSVSSQLSSEGRDPSNSSMSYRYSYDPPAWKQQQEYKTPVNFNTDAYHFRGYESKTWDNDNSDESYFQDLDSLDDDGEDGDDFNHSTTHVDQEQVKDEDPVDVVSRLVAATRSGGSSDGFSNSRMSIEGTIPNFLPPPVPHRTSSSLPMAPGTSGGWKSDANESAFFNRGSSLQARGSSDSSQPSYLSSSRRPIGSKQQVTATGLLDDYIDDVDVEPRVTRKKPPFIDEFEFRDDDIDSSTSSSRTTTSGFISSSASSTSNGGIIFKTQSSENAISDDVNFPVGARRPTSTLSSGGPPILIPPVISVRLTSSASSDSSASSALLSVSPSRVTLPLNSTEKLVENGDAIDMLERNNWTLVEDFAINDEETLVVPNKNEEKNEDKLVPVVSE